MIAQVCFFLLASWNDALLSLFRCDRRVGELQEAAKRQGAMARKGVSSRVVVASKDRSANVKMTFDMFALLPGRRGNDV